MARQRLDVALVELGHVESREQARRAIMAGEVFVQGQRQSKASFQVSGGETIEYRGTPRFVGRGGWKLEGALEAFDIRVEGKRCLDVGSSTGGFTDCLLQHGAREVTAVDVGTNQLVWKLRQDPRVHVFEGMNARHLAADDLRTEEGLSLAPFDLLVVDVSFISLRRILPPALALLEPGVGACAVALIKPQFEAGRRDVGKGGIVRDERVRQRVVEDLRAWLGKEGASWGVCDERVIPSPITGREGNQEFLWHLVKV